MSKRQKPESAPLRALRFELGSEGGPDVVANVAIMLRDMAGTSGHFSVVVHNKHVAADLRAWDEIATGQLTHAEAVITTAEVETDRDAAIARALVEATRRIGQGTFVLPDVGRRHVRVAMDRTLRDRLQRSLNRYAPKHTVAFSGSFEFESRVLRLGRSSEGQEAKARVELPYGIGACDCGLGGDLNSFIDALARSETKFLVHAIGSWLESEDGPLLDKESVKLVGISEVHAANSVVAMTAEEQAAYAEIWGNDDSVL